MSQPSAVFHLIDEMLASEENCLSVTELCRWGKVSRAGYYRWKGAEETRRRREEQDKKDFQMIKKAAEKTLSPGARSIYMELLHDPECHIMNLKKIRRLMRKYGLRCRVRRRNPRRQLADEMKSANYARNVLQRRFAQYGPRMVLLTDITYLPYKDGFLYLSVIKDACTREILAHALSESLEVDFVLETLQHLMRDHGTSLHALTLIHSDQGCHYTSYRYIDLVEKCQLIRSMSRRGNCWDNAPQESFFGHMKDEIDLSGCQTVEEVRKRVNDYIDYYDNRRYQWELCKLAPSEYYRFITTKKYPLDSPNPPAVPVFKEVTADCWDMGESSPFPIT